MSFMKILHSDGQTHTKTKIYIYIYIVYIYIIYVALRRPDKKHVVHEWRCKHRFGNFDQGIQPGITKSSDLDYSQVLNPDKQTQPDIFGFQIFLSSFLGRRIQYFLYNCASSNLRKPALTGTQVACPEKNNYKKDVMPMSRVSIDMK